MTDRFANDALWEATYPHIFPPESRLAAADQVDALLSLVGDRSETVLGSAAGRAGTAFPSPCVSVT